MIATKVFKSGNSQAVRLPKEFRVDTDEVFINRIGNVIMILPKDNPWDVFSEGIQEMGEDFPEQINDVEPIDNIDIE